MAAMEGEGKLKSIKASGKPIQSRILFVRANYSCPLEYADAVDDLDYLGDYVWAKAFHADVVSAVKKCAKVV
ncbi:hypothetical protein QJS10_CPB04g01568 [Acorus calamus]|uniref:Uncharacterized protein n=1 Tax=Acorus calamus TaxID=4465 RepID=A0AAV9EZ13_ACOCL|nr:hypothetical protein QJS10_CPB04g01568 [Acorus calamus]